MLVQLTTNLGSNDFPDMPYLDGETREVNEFIGAKLVRLGVAINVTPEPPAPVVVAEAPATVAENEAPKPDKFQKVRAENKHPK